MSNFAQYRTDQIAHCIADRSAFTTYGNLSGQPVETGRYSSLRNPYGWEGRHPEWAERLRFLEKSHTLHPLYVVRSFRTTIGVLVFDSVTLKSHWEIDYSASRWSSYSSRAVWSFRSAIDANSYQTYQSHQLGTIKTLHPEHAFPVFEIGKNWQAADDLSPTQKNALGAGRGKPQRQPTLAVLRRQGIIDELGYLTDFGKNVAAYCV